MSTVMNNSVEAEMQDVTVLHSDPSDELQLHDTEVQHVKKDDFLCSLVTQKTKNGKQIGSKHQKGRSMYYIMCEHPILRL